MRVLYAWPNSTFYNGGIKATLISTLDLGMMVRPNLDYLRVKQNEDIFCISATRYEVEKILLPAIHSEDHRLKVMCVMGNKDLPGLPFLVDRQAKCIQLIEKLPWRELQGKIITRMPFVELKETQIATLAALTVINIQVMKVQPPYFRASTPSLRPTPAWLANAGGP